MNVKEAGAPQARIDMLEHLASLLFPDARGASLSAAECGLDEPAVPAPAELSHEQYVSAVEQVRSHLSRAQPGAGLFDFCARVMCWLAQKLHCSYTDTGPRSSCVAFHQRAMRACTSSVSCRDSAPMWQQCSRWTMPSIPVYGTVTNVKTEHHIVIGVLHNSSTLSAPSRES
jgi:hypothetical protein